MSGFPVLCLGCHTEITEFTDTTGFMRCPDAHKSYDAISSLLPTFSSRAECDDAIQLLKKGGYDIHSWRGSDDHGWSPGIPVIQDLAERLMRYEAVNGARYHTSHILCHKCAENVRHCSACGHDHDPHCPICDATLVPLNQ